MCLMLLRYVNHLDFKTEMKKGVAPFLGSKWTLTVGQANIFFLSQSLNEVAHITDE